MVTSQTQLSLQSGFLRSHEEFSVILNYNGDFVDNVLLNILRCSCQALNCGFISHVYNGHCRVCRLFAQFLLACLVPREGKLINYHPSSWCSHEHDFIWVVPNISEYPWKGWFKCLCLTTSETERQEATSQSDYYWHACRTLDHRTSSDRETLFSDFVALYYYISTLLQIIERDLTHRVSYKSVGTASFVSKLTRLKLQNEDALILPPTTHKLFTHCHNGCITDVILCEQNLSNPSNLLSWWYPMYKDFESTIWAALRLSSLMFDL